MKGFTLVEMMVALLIFGLVAAAGVGLMTFSVDNQEIVRGHNARIAEFQRARALLKSDLAQAADRRTRGPDGRASPAFQAGAGAPPGVLLALVRRGWDNPDADARASLQYVEYRLTQGRLERRARPMLDRAPLGPPQVLLSGVRAAKVSVASQGAWGQAATGPQPGLPEAVRLELQLADMGPVTQLFLVSGAPW